MGYRPRTTGFRHALAASAAIHLLFAAVLVVAVHRTENLQTRPSALNTRADDVMVTLFPEEPAAPIAIPEKAITPDPPRASEPLPPEALQSPPEAVARTPHATRVPGSLSPRALDLIRRTTTIARSVPVADPAIQPVAAVAAPPIHGAMAAGKSVVYVLDCSGSMGEFGKFAIARTALAATLRGQPREVRFQVIAYHTSARPLLAGGCVPATAENLAAIESRLAALAASGRSNHLEAIRRAAALQPDVIVLITDTELTAGAVQPLIVAAGKTIPVCIAKVSGDGVASPRLLQ
jgi:hypothetical protein